MQVALCSSSDHEHLWNQYVDTHPHSTNYHRWGWKKVIESSFGWPTYYWIAVDNGSIQGALPVVWQKSRLFGSFLTSLPFLNAGGILASDSSTEQALLANAVALARTLNAKYLELRHREEHSLHLRTKTNKITLVLRVWPDSEKTWKNLGTKMRTKVRKSLSFGMTCEFGGLELLDDFYNVFCQNMRDLGTPVYSREFFHHILRIFPNDTYLCVVRHEKAPVAVSFLSGFRDRLEAIWSSSVQKYLHLKPNLTLYWNLLRFAGEKGYALFDFGRSSVGSGTHEFKLQWGAQPVQLHWDYWLANGDTLPELNPTNRKYRAAIWLWQRIPLSFTRLLGPPIVRCLP